MIDHCLFALKKLGSKSGFLTRRCITCGKQTASKKLCSTCAQELAPRLGGYCPRCGLVFGVQTDPAHLCSTCRVTPPPWHTIGFHNAHEGRLRELIMRFKFGLRLDVCGILQQFLYEAYERMQIPKPDMVVPVPLHTKRLLWRGFNQSGELARPLGKKLSCTIQHNALTRIRHTIPQTKLTRGQRQENIHGAFATQAHLIQQKHVLIVDDVLTTGATLVECAKTLKRAGARRIDVLVLSVAAP